MRDLVNSANANAEASADALADARLELHAELARDYVNLRGFDDEAKLFSDTIAIYRSALKLTQDRLAANIVSPVDVDRAQAQLSSAEAQLSDLTAQSRDAGKFHRGAGRQVRGLIFGCAIFDAASAAEGRRARCRPTCCAAVQTSQKAERQTAAASELIGASRANFFPRLSLIALGGTQDTNFRLFNPDNLFGTIGPSIDFPLFDAGLRQAELADRQGPIHRGGGELSGHGVARA